MSPVKEILMKKLDKLPESDLTEVLDFVDKISRKVTQQSDPILSIIGILSGNELSSQEIENELYGKSIVKNNEF